MDDANIYSVALVAYKTSVAAASLFGIVVATKVDVGVEKSQRIVGKHTVDAGITTPLGNGGDKADITIAKNDARIVAVDIVSRVEIGLVFVHEEEIERIGFAGTAGITGGTKIRSVDSGKSIISEYISC